MKVDKNIIKAIETLVFDIFKYNRRLDAETWDQILEIKLSIFEKLCIEQRPNMRILWLMYMMENSYMEFLKAHRTIDLIDKRYINLVQKSIMELKNLLI